MDGDSTLLETCLRIARETRRDVIYHAPAKKVEEYPAHSIFHCEFGILYLVW
jgi:hypothetical protein